MKKFVPLLSLLLMLAVALPCQAAGFSQPALITSVGQSADGQMVRVLADRSSLEYQYDATASSISGYKTLILVVGGSSKGLGAAGINPAQEEQRVRDLISAAKNSGVKILAMHVGGEARRGDLTDQFIRIAVPSADHIIVVADGNQDNIFGQLGNGVPLDQAESIADAARFLKAAF
jgi:hypothetical protein